MTRADRPVADLTDLHTAVVGNLHWQQAGPHMARHVIDDGTTAYVTTGHPIGGGTVYLWSLLRWGQQIAAGQCDLPHTAMAFADRAAADADAADRGGVT